MKHNDIEGNEKIKQAYVNAVPDICDVILSDCEKEKGKVIVLEKTKKKRNTMKYIMAAASLFLVFGAGTLLFRTYQTNYAVASTVSLDVNPSIQITVNEKERVLDVKALNKDGGIVIGDMDFSGSDIDVTVNALIGSMLRKGYLNELANSILISVDNTDPDKGEILQKRLTEEVNELLESDGFFAAVLGQTLSNDDVLQQQADLYGISIGKAQLIQQILDSTEGHTFEELAPLSINELNLLIASGASDMEKVSALGSASDKAYIGEEKAKEIAFAHANAAASDIYFYEMDMDVEKGVMVYELEFKCGGYEYEYDINAQTGDIIKNKKEIDDDMPAGMTAQASGKGETASESGAALPVEETTAPPVETIVPPSGNSGTYHHSEQHHGEAHHGTYIPEQNDNTQTASQIITVDKAKEIALNHAGLTADAVYLKKAELDYDDGMQIYEVEFISGNVEYEYEIDAATGAIRDYEWD